MVGQARCLVQEVAAIPAQQAAAVVHCLPGGLLLLRPVSRLSKLQ